MAFVKINRVLAPYQLGTGSKRVIMINTDQIVLIQEDNTTSDYMIRTNIYGNDDKIFLDKWEAQKVFNAIGASLD